MPLRTTPSATRWRFSMRYSTDHVTVITLEVQFLFQNFFSRIRAAYHCIKMKKKLVQCSVTTQMKQTPDGHKPARQLNTTRKKNSNMNYSHSAQLKRLTLSIALSQHSIPRRESALVLQHQKYVMQHVHVVRRRSFAKEFLYRLRSAEATKVRRAPTSPSRRMRSTAPAVLT